MIKPAEVKKHILLVDGDRNVTGMLSLLFETRGYRVTVARTGRETLQKATRNIDLILLDTVLPDQEGFRVCRCLKENKETSDVSIIILTAKMLTEDIVEALYLGADDYLTKPFEYEELVARMEAVMRRRTVREETCTGSNVRGDIVCELREIIKQERIVPYFQPIFGLKPLRVLGFESLSRPVSKTLLSSPEILFRFAIQYGVYQDIELLAWKKTLEYAAGLADGEKLFLNCNPYLVEGSKFKVIKNLFKQANIDPQNVYLEITERSAVTNFKSFYRELTAYRNHGFKFAIDDVGGGYASLESIIETRPEVVKIDRHIVHRMHSDALRRSIVKFIVSFCAEHGILSVAEGIESWDDFQVAKELGVDAGQGYYFHKPAPSFIDREKIISKINAL